MAISNQIPPFLLVLAGAIAWQSSAATEIDSIVVTASRLDRTAAEIAQSATIVDRAAIDARQYANVTELLRHVAGVNVIQQGGRGGVTSVVIRGGESILRSFSSTALK